MTRPTASHTFPYDVAATCSALIIGIALMALAAGSPLEWGGKALFVAGCLGAITISFFDTMKQRGKAPTTESQRG